MTVSVLFAVRYIGPEDRPEGHKDYTDFYAINALRNLAVDTAQTQAVVVADAGEFEHGCHVDMRMPRSS